MRNLPKPLIVTGAAVVAVGVMAAPAFAEGDQTPAPVDEGAGDVATPGTVTGVVGTDVPGIDAITGTVTLTAEGSEVAFATAEIYDGEFSLAAPAGEYVLTVTPDPSTGLAPWSQDVTIVGEGNLNVGVVKLDKPKPPAVAGGITVKVSTEVPGFENITGSAALYTAGNPEPVASAEIYGGEIKLSADAGDYTLVISPDGLDKYTATVTIEGGSDRDLGVVSLTKTETPAAPAFATGKVVAEDGSAITAEVTLSDGDTVVATAEVYGGNYSLTAPAGSYTLTVTPQDGYKPYTTQVTLASGPQALGDITIEKVAAPVTTGELAGVATAEGVERVKGVAELKDAAGETIASSDLDAGRFHFNVEAGSYKLVITPSADLGLVELVKDVVVTAGATQDLGSLVLTKVPVQNIHGVVKGKVSTKVAEHAAKKLSGAVVLKGIGTNTNTVAGLLVSGEFTVSAPAGVYELTVAPNSIYKLNSFKTKVTVTKDGTVTVPNISLVRAPAKALKAPDIVGTAAFGKTLTVKKATWDVSGVTVKHQWLRDGRAIAGATGTSYKVKAADIGKKLTVQVNASKAGYDTATVKSASVAAGKAVSSAAISVTKKNKTSVTVTVKVKGSAGVTPKGKVWIKVGKKTTKVNVAKGKAVLVLKKVKFGKFTVNADFKSTAALLKDDKAKPVKVTIKKYDKKSLNQKHGFKLVVK